MRNINVITNSLVCRGNRYKVMRFTSETPDEKKFGARPWIAVHESYSDSDLPLNGLQMLITRDTGDNPADFQELIERADMDAAARNYRAKHPDWDPSELMQYLMEECGVGIGAASNAI